MRESFPVVSSQIQEPKFNRILVAATCRKRLCEQTLPHRLRTVRPSRQRKRARTRRLRSKQRSTNSSVRQKPKQEIQGVQTLQVSPRRDLRCGSGRRDEERRTSSFTKRSVAASSVATRSPKSRNIKTDIPTSRTEQILKPVIAIPLHTHIRKKRH